MPSKSQIDFALRRDLVSSTTESRIHSRFRVYLVQQSPAVLAMEHTAESPWLILERLDILDLNQQNVARFRGVDVKWTREVVDLGEVDVFDVVRGVVVLDLSAGPVETFDLDRFSVGDFPAGGD